MNRMTLPSSPLLLGFEELERLIDRSMKSSGDGYPPYNIERLAPDSDTGADVLRITLAVAGFAREQLDIQLEDKQLTIRGKQVDEEPRTFIHRGIAARQFSRSFVLADGLEVRSAGLNNGLLSIDLVRLTPERKITTISIADKNSRT
jgi:HSP20 family molecular chaperone IbpA